MFVLTSVRLLAVKNYFGVLFGGFHSCLSVKITHNINDVSRESKVSPTTVSRVLNGLSKKYRISAQTEALVLKTAERLNYRPNQAAVNFRLKKTNTIGLLIPNLGNPFFANMAAFIAADLHKKGYSLIISDCSEDEKIEVEMLHQLADRRIDGLLISPTARKPEVYEALYKKGLPVVYFDRYFKKSIIPFVSTQNFEGAYQITKHLIAAGHKHIACIQATHGVMPVIERLKGYKKAMKEAGLQSDAVGTGFSLENGYNETKLLLKRAAPPTAIFAFTNPIALGSMKALKEEGKNVPKDVSLVTFDDSEYLAFVDPPITAVKQPVMEIAQTAVKLLLHRIEQGQNPAALKPENFLLNPQIVQRASVRKL